MKSSDNTPRDWRRWLPTGRRYIPCRINLETKHVFKRFFNWRKFPVNNNERPTIEGELENRIIRGLKICCNGVSERLTSFSVWHAIHFLASLRRLKNQQQLWPRALLSISYVTSWKRLTSWKMYNVEFTWSIKNAKRSIRPCKHYINVNRMSVNLWHVIGTTFNGQESTADADARIRMSRDFLWQLTGADLQLCCHVKIPSPRAFRLI